MSPETPGTRRAGLRHVLAGIGAGVEGALFVITFLMLGSLWRHRSVWLTTNLFSTAFFGADAYINRFASTSLAGVAIVLIMYGVAGAVWGVVFGDRVPRHVLFYGALCGIVTWFVLFQLFWKRLDPFFWLYAPERELEFANIIWGMIVARSPVFVARMRQASADAQEPAMAEVRSGELIR